MITAVKTIGCVKAATDILGDKWTPQLIRFLANEKSIRFCQLQDLAGGINPRTLSARLAHLEREHIIEKSATTSLARCEYHLTEKGMELLPIIRDMERWSSHYTHRQS
ncbi:MAG TPA: helix-turn-helix domain-containing protein [Candidatus Saccharimonadales bacterium]|jgi:DNA-binding HxlR family transcriptional regulator|nr:helix-turn-helix domain-containing protein [Candidatus Saccharimonadales bacterium]